MFLNRISRQNHRYSALRHVSTAASTTTQSPSRLRTRYPFTPPPSLLPEQPPPPPPPRPKPKKPRYQPPSSLHPTRFRFRSQLPFDFRFSYTESTPHRRPIGIRGPRFSPFGPNRLDREWTGFVAPVRPPIATDVDGEVGGKPVALGIGEEDERLVARRRKVRERFLGEPLTEDERVDLVDRCLVRHNKAKINLGRYGLTHNTLDVIHNHWKNSETVRIKCMGVSTVDMKNVCTQLEDKSAGKIIYRRQNILVLYRGRNYKPWRRPIVPLMLWKPNEPVYPKLIKTTIEGLSIIETKEIRKRGLAVPALIRLRTNGYFGNLVAMVADAFLVDALVRIDCTDFQKSDIRKIGVKLRDLVPCIIVTFNKEQVVVWNGKEWRPKDVAPIVQPEPTNGKELGHRDNVHPRAGRKRSKLTVDDLTWI